jgi:GH15 family glucan-1,4-alpha-glucosidase
MKTTVAGETPKPPSYGIPLRRYALLGDGRSAALVSDEGSVDWWCPDRFDAPSVFARLLDADAGRFAVSFAGAVEASYEPGTNVLVHRWRDGELLDFQPWPPVGTSCVVRVLRAKRDAVARVDFDPRANYGARAGGCMLHGAEPGELRLRAGETRVLVACPGPAPAGDPLAWLDATRAAWRAWTAKLRYHGPHRRAVERSLLALKLLVYEPTGALVAAPTTSLPEAPGGERNWDYRYAWLRDTGFAAEAFHRSGYEEEAHALAGWVLRAVEKGGKDLRVLYTVDAGACPDERDLPLRGRLGSRPVRVGNGAVDQFQLDAYGHVIECLHLSGALREPRHAELWRHVAGLVDRLCELWRRDDNGIWEVPAGPRPFTYSKAMAWVAFDRAARIARELRLDAPLDRWERERDEAWRVTQERGYDADRASFVQSFGSKALDAANLRLPLVGFVGGTDPRMLSTLDATLRELEHAGYVRRYVSDDGLSGTEGAFLPCSFWLVQALARAGRREEAERLFASLAQRMEPWGLAPEEMDPATGSFLGNYPQAFTHAALVTAAWEIASR